MNPVDVAALIVLLLSSVFGLARGFAREAFGLAAWVLAVIGTIRLFPDLRPFAGRLIENAGLADIAAYAVGFIVLLVAFSVVADLISRVVRTTPFVGGIDRLLGFGFGALRGAAILAATYVLAGLAAPPASWPMVVRQAQATPLVYEGAVWAASLAPSALRPRVAAPDAPDPSTDKTI
jgi:membrane protein required for colicin V production